MVNMFVEILYFARLKEITKKDKEVFELSGYNLLEVIDMLFKKYPSLKEIMWDKKEQELKSQFTVVIDNEIMKKGGRLSMSLHNGNTIAFLPPFSGG
jgi:MoaD family protein